jgi:hypothetical protein
MTTLVTEAEILPLCLFNLRVRLCSLVSRVGLEHIKKKNAENLANGLPQVEFTPNKLTKDIRQNVHKKW